MQTFLTKQRAVLKIYLIHEIERSKSYGWAYRQSIALKNKAYQPTNSEIYKALHELTADGMVQRKKRQQVEKGEGLGEIVVYSFTEEGSRKAQLYKQQVKEDLERSRRLIDAILKDIYS
ncbi:MAG: helix-turn-helix transcriptional regulator [Sporolactobacillus sp.]